MQVDLNRPLPPALRLAGWPGETVYSFAHRLERRLHATRGVISHLAYADVSRVLGTRATPAQVTERMVTLCQTLCQLEPGTLSAPMDKGSFSAHLCAECVGDPGAEHVWDGQHITDGLPPVPRPNDRRPIRRTHRVSGLHIGYRRRSSRRICRSLISTARDGSPHGWSRRWYAEWGPPVGQSTTV